MSGLPSELGPILDYASPRQHGKVRLPSHSRIVVELDRDRIIVREWLEAKAGAIMAMVIAVFTLLALAMTMYQGITGRMHRDDRLWLVAVPGVVGACEIWVFLLVVNNTWRRTVLEVRSDALLLAFASPFGDRRYEWGASQIEDIRVDLTTTAKNRNTLGELVVHLAGLPLVKLFTDHPAAELAELSGRLRQAVGLGASSAANPALESSHEPDCTSL
jgi:hypothetical protein